MGDMFDTYNQVRVGTLGQRLKKTKRDAQAIIEEVEQERDRALGGQDIWKVHYYGLEAERDYLLEMLDEAYGGADNNPAREVASDSIRIPNGPREGELVQKRDRIYLARLKAAISEKAAYLGSWKDLIRKHHIFD